MKDILGKEIKVGDFVAFSVAHYHDILKIGKVVNIGKMASVLYKAPNGKMTKTPRYSVVLLSENDVKNVVDINDYNV